MTPTVPDGPDTELAAAIGFLARNEGLLIEMEHSPAGRAAATIVRAVLARPAAGRDLTAQDVGVALDGVTHLSRQIRDEVARELNGIARPAVARTDGQPPAEGLDPLAHVQPGHAADDMLCGDQHGPWNCTRDLQHPGQHIASIGHGQRVGAVWPAAPADEPAPTFRSARSRRRGEIADPAADLAAYDRVLADVPADYPGLPLMQARREELRALAAGAAAPADTPTCRYCGADCSGGRSWDGGDLYACQSCADARATRNAAPADDTAAPDQLRDARTGAVLDVLRKAIASTIGTTSLLPSSRAAGQLWQVAARCVDAAVRPGSLPSAGQPVRDSQLEAAASDDRTHYELQVPPPPPAHVTAVRPRVWGDGAWTRDGDDWVRGRERCTWDELLHKYDDRGVEPAAAARPVRDGGEPK